MVKEGNVDKIVEIVHDVIFKVTGCKDLKSGELYLSKELTKAILALIEQDQKDNADGLTVAYMMGSEDMKAKYKPMVEALKEAKEFVEAYIEQYKPQYSNPKNLLAEIDAVLQKGEG